MLEDGQAGLGYLVIVEEGVDGRHIDVFEPFDAAEHASDGVVRHRGVDPIPVLGFASFRAYWDPPHWPRQRIYVIAGFRVLHCNW